MARRDDRRRGSADLDVALRHEHAFQESARRLRVEPLAVLSLMTLSTRFARSGQAPATRPERSRGARSRQVRFWCHAAIVFAILVPRASAAQSADVQAGK